MTPETEHLVPCEYVLSLLHTYFSMPFYAVLIFNKKFEHRINMKIFLNDQRYFLRIPPPFVIAFLNNQH